jgi:hypothetical protein
MASRPAALRVRQGPAMRVRQGGRGAASGPPSQAGRPAGRPGRGPQEAGRLPRQEALDPEVLDVGEVLAEGRLGLVVDAVAPAAGAEASRAARCPPRAFPAETSLVGAVPPHPLPPKPLASGAPGPYRFNRFETVSNDLRPFQTI